MSTQVPNQIARSKDASANVFVNYLFDIFRETINAEDVVTVEDKEGELPELLDMYAGIDVLVEQPGQQGPVGIANRVNSKPFATFTIGKSEKVKLENNTQGGSLAPTYTCQSIVCNGELINAAIISTEKLVEYIRHGEKGDPNHNDSWVTTDGGDYYWQAQNGGDDRFIAVPWRDIRDCVDAMDIAYLDHTGAIVDSTSQQSLYKLTEQ